MYSFGCNRREIPRSHGTVNGFSADFLVGGGRPLSGDLLDGLDGVNEGHGDVEGEEDDGGVAEADDVDGEAGHRGAHKVAQGEGREPDSCKVEKEKSRRWAAAAAAAARFSNDWADWRRRLRWLDGGRGLLARLETPVQVAVTSHLTFLSV